MTDDRLADLKGKLIIRRIMYAHVQTAFGHFAGNAQHGFITTRHGTGVMRGQHFAHDSAEHGMTGRVGGAGYKLRKGREKFQSVIVGQLKGTRPLVGIFQLRDQRLYVDDHGEGRLIHFVGIHAVVLKKLVHKRNQVAVKEFLAFTMCLQLAIGKEFVQLLPGGMGGILIRLVPAELRQEIGQIIADVDIMLVFPGRIAPDDGIEQLCIHILKDMKKG